VKWLSNRADGDLGRCIVSGLFVLAASGLIIELAVIVVSLVLVAILLRNP
jgi:hypothetical protein